MDFELSENKGSKEKFSEIFWPKPKSCAILPIFLPFMGCPAHCVFCAQDRQTGINAPLSAEFLEQMLNAKKDVLKKRAMTGRGPMHIAFYGGTFTAIPDRAWNMCLEFVKECLKEGLIDSFRCSTRPDSLKPGRLTQLALCGCSLVELGIQSFDDCALEQAGRNYKSADCLSAFVKLRDAGLAAGAQLMPGMPGVNEKVFISDVHHALELKTAVLRFYPCMVVGGTKLAALWQTGKFSPWPLQTTIDTLAAAWNMAREKNVPVIRMGLAPEPELEKSVLAGPGHPSLGSQIMAKAMLFAVAGMRGEMSVHLNEDTRLFAPRNARGFFWGWKGNLAPEWRKMGITRKNVMYWDKDSVKLERLGENPQDILSVFQAREF